MERRAFFKLAGLSATAFAAGGVLGACSSVERISNTLVPSADSDGASQVSTVVAQPPVSFSNSVDVLIVGSGVSGLSAAMAPAEAGYKVMVVDKLSLLGGESYDADGIMHVAGSKLQKKAGFAQSAEDAWPARKKELSAAGVGNLDFAKSLYLAAPRWVDPPQLYLICAISRR